MTIKINKDFDIDIPEEAKPYLTNPNINTVEAEGKVGFTNGKLLFDVYPFKSSSFHITAGAYFGSSQVAKVYNKEDGLLLGVSDFNNAIESGLIPGYTAKDKLGVELGDYLLEPDDKGNIEAYIKTAGFKPYVGIGFGRAVPKKRVGFMVELGCQFWGGPKVYCFDHELTEEDVDGKDGGIIKTLSKVSVYPVLNFRICGKIF